MAHLHTQAFTFIKDEIDVTLASGEEWLLEGNIIEKNYAVGDSPGPARHPDHAEGGPDPRPVHHRRRRGTDPAMAFALVWAVDRWVERD